jgi:hypothetical protein
VEPLLQQVAKTGVIETKGCETKENFKKKAVKELEKAWIDKKMYDNIALKNIYSV